MNIESLNDIWNAVCEEIKASGEVTEAGFNLWIKDLKPVELRQDGFILSTSGDIKKNVVETTYMPILTSSLKNII